MSRLAQRVELIAPFQVMQVLERAKEIEQQGKDVIHLEVGEPDFVAETSVEKAAVNAISAGQTGYTPAAGLPELKQKIAHYYQTKYQVSVNPARIILTPGASGALLLLSSMLVDVGANVLMPDPCYPCNRNFLSLVGGNAKLVPTSSTANFAIPTEDISTLWDKKTCGLWLASPNNPTGSVLSRDYIESAFAAVNQCGGHLMVDEIYQGLVYDGEDITALSVSDDIFVINSFSKYFAMTGWRLGWIVVPEWAIDAATKLAQNLFISAPTIAQYAALKAFDHKAITEFEFRKNLLNERRKTLLTGLQALGLQPVVPAQGAFYIYVDISAITSDAKQWCLDLLEAEFVALTPGEDFGVRAANKYVRFAYTCDNERLQEALRRIGRFLQDNN